MQDKVSYKKKLRINFSPEETRASKGKRYVFFGIIVILITFFMVFSSVGAVTELAPSNTFVLSNQSVPLAVYNQSGKEVPFATVGSTAEYTSSNISYIMTNVTAGEMSQNDVGKIFTDTCAPNASAKSSVAYSPLSSPKAFDIGTQPQSTTNTSGSPKALLYYQANNTIYAANSTGNNIWAINATTGAIIKSIVVGPVGVDPGFMALDPKDGHIFVTSSENNSIFVINATTNKLNATITAPTDSNPYGVSNPPTSSGPSGIAFNPKTGTLCVVLTNNAVLDTLNASQNKITGTYFSWGTDYHAPYTVFVSPEGLIYVWAYGISSSTGPHLDRIFVFKSPTSYSDQRFPGCGSYGSYDSFGIAYDPVNNFTYLSDSKCPSISAYNSTGVLRVSIGLNNGCNPLGLAYVPFGDGGKGFIYVATAANKLLLINTTSESVVWKGAATDPGELIYASIANKVFMTDTGGAVVSFSAVQQHPVKFVESLSSGSTDYPPFTLSISSSTVTPSKITVVDSDPSVANYVVECLFNASYTWTANATFKYSAISGSFTEASSGTTIINLVFPPSGLDIGITESGLPSGTTWDFNITSPIADKATHSSSTTAISFGVPNGTYSFFIPCVKSGSTTYGVLPSNATGNFTISASSQCFFYHVQFVSANAVTFDESGLNLGSGNFAYAIPSQHCYILADPIANNWDSAEFNIGSISHYVNNISFLLVGTGEVRFALGSTGVDSTNILNWTTFNVSSPYGQLYCEHISPVLLKDGTNYYLSVEILSGGVSWEEQYTSNAQMKGVVDTYCYYNGDVTTTTFTFLYSVGLIPSAGISDSWGVKIHGQNLSTTSQSTSIDLLPGTYNYTIYTQSTVNSSASKSGTSTEYLFGGNGTVTVGSSAKSVALTFNLVTLYQKGLPVNDSWSVRFASGGAVNISSGETSIYLPLLNGSYKYFGVSPNPNYTASSGSFTTSNNSKAAIIYTLNTYSITFTEGLLPRGISWTVALGSLSNSSMQPSISFKVANGTYKYMITAVGYTASPASGQITISGKSVNISTVFSLTPSQPTVPAYTITIGFGTSYQNFKPVATFTFTHPMNTINVLPIYYLSVNPSYHLIFEINQSAPLHYFLFNLSGNTGAFSGIGYNGFSDLGYIIGGTGIIIALFLSAPWISIYRADEKWKKTK